MIQFTFKIEIFNKHSHSHKYITSQVEPFSHIYIIKDVSSFSVIFIFCDICLSWKYNEFENFGNYKMISFHSKLTIMISKILFWCLPKIKINITIMKILFLAEIIGFDLSKYMVKYLIGNRLFSKDTIIATHFQTITDDR